MNHVRFPLVWQDGKVAEMFTPDFYLPESDLYIELTTLKQSLITEKNRKLRLLRGLYPEINIKLLNKSDYLRLLAKYGYGRLGGTKLAGINHVLFSHTQIQRRVKALANAFRVTTWAGDCPVGIRRCHLFRLNLMQHIMLPVNIDLMAISDHGTDDGSR